MPRFSILSAGLAAILIAAPLGAQRVAPPADLTDIDFPVVYLVDASNGQVLFEREADRRFVPASVTKVMTLFTAFELIDDGKLAPHHLLTVSPEAWMEWRGKGSTMFLNADDRVPLSELLTGIANVYDEAQLRGILVNSKKSFPDTVMPAFYNLDDIIRPGHKYTGKAAETLDVTIMTAQQIEDIVALLKTFDEPLPE